LRQYNEGENNMRGRMWRLAIYVFVLGFILNLLGIVSHVVVSAFAKRWFGTPFPRSLTTEWFSYAWTEFGLAQVLGVTIFVALTVVALTLLMAFPAAYILARRNFRWKSVLILLYFLPILIPQMTYGIPLATTLFRYGVGGSVAAVILAVMVPMVPLAIFVLMPFFEQTSINLEWGAAMMGANKLQIFRRILLPLTLPGLLTAGILVLVNTVSNFELSFLVSGAGSQTLVVALFYNVFAGGVRPVYSVDAMAVMYMTIVMILLLIALRYVRPTQMVFRLDQPKR
jgi:putative spermidine/putrescine transport system permease protein